MKRLTVILWSVLALVSTPSTVLAQTTSSQFQDPLGGVRPVDVIERIITFFLSLAAPLALLGIVYGALLIVGGFGNEQQTARAKKIILWSLIGFGIVVLSYIILRTLATTILGI